jgi:hypothetical protein
MDWDELEEILYVYWVELPGPKIDYAIWWYGDGGIKEMLQTYHIDTKPKPSAHKVRWIYGRGKSNRPIWARAGGDNEKNSG